MSSERIEVRRLIRAPAERIFAAWTQPNQLRTWWGPPGVRCLEASVDLSVGGTYRIVNELSDGSRMTIFGKFTLIVPPRLLTYTWGTDPRDPATEQVTVRFEPRGADTEIVIIHEQIPDPSIREQHKNGWEGCLDGLQEYLVGDGNP
jgi:uncharacterized protein YndB with AHSA1/START domain